MNPADRPTSTLGGPPAVGGAEQRAHPRRHVLRRGWVEHRPTGAAYPCLIVDISLGGARLQLYAPDVPGQGLTLHDPGVGYVHELRVAWRISWFMGVAFTHSARRD